MKARLLMKAWLFMIFMKSMLAIISLLDVTNYISTAYS